MDADGDCPSSSCRARFDAAAGAYSRPVSITVHVSRAERTLRIVDDCNGMKPEVPRYRDAPAPHPASVIPGGTTLLLLSIFTHRGSSGPGRRRTPDR